MEMEKKTRMSLLKKRGDLLGLEICSISIFIDVYTTTKEILCILSNQVQVNAYM